METETVGIDEETKKRIIHDEMVRRGHLAAGRRYKSKEQKDAHIKMMTRLSIEVRKQRKRHVQPQP